MSAISNFIVALCSLYCFAPTLALKTLQLVLEDEFDDFNLSLWKHEITLSGGGNWEFQYYLNNRTNSFVRDGNLFINPTLLAEQIGEGNVKGGFTLNIWGGAPADLCTGNAFYGCSRISGPGGGGNYLNPIQSARIRTAESFSFTYGKVEVRAKLPKGDWLWPAIWLLPRHNQYGGWPASGEIDIMESRGNPTSYAPGGSNVYGSTLHWGPIYNENAWAKTHAIWNGSDLTEDFHVYGFIWNETYIGTYIDDEANVVLSHSINQSFWDLGGWPSPPWNNPWQGRGKSAPFDRDFYLIINLAVGGTNGYFPDGFGKPWNNTSPNAVNEFYNDMAQWYPTWTQPMQIDSVRVWSYKEPTFTGNGASGNYAALWKVCPLVVFLMACVTGWQYI